VITAEDVENALCGSSRAQTFIETYGKMDRARWKALTVRGNPDDPWFGHCIFADGAGHARKVETNGYHPRRGNGDLFRRYDAILARLGLGHNFNGGDEQHVIWPKDQTPPTRVRDAIFQCEDKFGISSAGQTHMRAVPITIHERVIPDWTQSDVKVRAFIVHRFPTMGERTASGRSIPKPVSKRARKRAAQLALIMYYWFRLLLPQTTIADDLGIEPDRVNRTANDARRHGDRLFSPEGCDCGARRSARNPTRQVSLAAAV
jgi:hypothetical protein